MRQSELFSKTKKETIREETSEGYKFLVKGDFVERISSGVYALLPLGYKVHRKIEDIIRQEMDSLSGQEVFLVSLIDKGLWQETGRWTAIDPPLFKTKDRHQKEFGLGSTHEEVMVKLAQSRIFSYKDLPKYLYQIQTKFRNELRATGGLLRTREFVMKDLYSFHSSKEDFEDYFERVAESYEKIFKRCGLQTIKSEASGGTISGSTKTFEFQVESKVGEDKVVCCPSCEFAANKEVCSRKQGQSCPGCGSPLKEISTIEVGHIFSLGTKYSKPFDLYFTNQKGEKELVWMGCYGIGLGRLMGTIAEVHHDAKGLCWPKEVAPYVCHLIQLGPGKKIKTASEKIYSKLKQENIEVLYDDREEANAAEKLHDADLLGMPVRIVVSAKTLGENRVELKERKAEKVELVQIERLSQSLLKLLN